MTIWANKNFTLHYTTMQKETVLGQIDLHVGYTIVFYMYGTYKDSDLDRLIDDWFFLYNTVNKYFKTHNVPTDVYYKMLRKADYYYSFFEEHYTDDIVKFKKASGFFPPSFSFEKFDTKDALKSYMIKLKKRC